MSKKIGILTFHRSINYGSFLQSYSLATALKNYTDFEVEVIDYNMASVELNCLTSVFISPVTQIYKNMVKYRRFKKALYNKLPISQEKLISNRLERAKDFIKNRYDIIIVGSDEVWKINTLRGFPNIYWLQDESDSIKVSYAASANRTRFDKIEPEGRKFIKDALSKFSYIGVRDQNTIEQLKKIDKSLRIKRNCDPAFLFDLHVTHNIEASIREKLLKYKLDPDKPMLGIMCSDQNICRRIYEKYSSSCQIVSLYINTKYSDVFLYDLDPFEWAHIFKFFSFSVTNFFHCTVFSILNKLPFIAIDVEESSVVYESKIKDLLKRADLLENYFNIKNPSFDWEKVFDQIEENMVYPKKDKMQSFVEDEKKYFTDFVTELKKISGG